VDKLRTKEALDFYNKQIYPRHLRNFPLFGLRPTASGRQGGCRATVLRWPHMRRTKNPARSFGGICKAQNFTTGFDSSANAVLPD
jgi:hypothetical protein